MTDAQQVFITSNCMAETKEKEKSYICFSKMAEDMFSNVSSFISFNEDDVTSELVEGCDQQLNNPSISLASAELSSSEPQHPISGKLDEGGAEGGVSVLSQSTDGNTLRQEPGLVVPEAEDQDFVKSETYSDLLLQNTAQEQSVKGGENCSHEESEILVSDPEYSPTGMVVAQDELSTVSKRSLLMLNLSRELEPECSFVGSTIEEYQIELERSRQRELRTKNWVNDLRRTLRKTIDENEDMIRDIGRLLETCQSLDSKRRAAIREQRRLVFEGEYLHEQNEDLREELANLEEHQQLMQEAQEQLALQLTNQIKEMEEANLLVQDQVSQLQEQLAQSKQDKTKALHALESKHRLVTQEVQVLREEKLKLVEQLKGFKEQCKSKERHKEQALNHKHSELQEQNQYLREQNQLLQEEKSKLVKLLKECKEDQREAAKALESYYKAEYLQESKRIKEEKVALQTQLKKTQEKVEDLRKTVQEERGFKTFAWRRIRQLEILVYEHSTHSTASSAGTMETMHSTSTGTGSITRASDLSFFSFQCESCGTATNGGACNPVSPKLRRPRLSQNSGQKENSGGGASSVLSKVLRVREPQEPQSTTDPAINSLPVAYVAGGVAPTFIPYRTKDALEKTSRGGATERARRKNIDRLLLCTSQPRQRNIKPLDELTETFGLRRSSC